MSCECNNACANVSRSLLARVCHVGCDLYCIPVFPLLYLKGAPRPVCEWLVCNNADSCTVVCSMVVAPKCCGYLWLPTISSETHYQWLKCGRTSVHSTCTHSRLCIHSDYPSAHCISLQSKSFPLHGQYNIP